MRNDTVRAILLSFLFVSITWLILESVWPSKRRERATQIHNNRDLIRDDSLNLGERDDLTKRDKIKERASEVRVENLNYIATFSTYNASLRSLKLKKHLNLNKDFVELINESEGNFASLLALDLENYSTAPFSYKALNEREHEFSSILNVNGEQFKYVKTYKFSSEDEYLILVELDLKPIKNGKLNFVNLSLYPQIEKFTLKEMQQYKGFTKSALYYDNKLRYAKEGLRIDDFKWTALSSKYFTFLLAIPENSFKTLNFKRDENNFLTPNISLSLKDNTLNEKIYIYAGPKASSYLKIFDSSEENSFKVKNLLFERVISKGFLYPLQALMKAVMQIFYDVIPNWGLAIIFLTIFVRILIFPLTYKSYRASAELSKLQPQMKAIQDKYKDNQVLLQQEMQKLYKAEGVNPLSGCLPILLQLPIFFSLYGLVNEFFQLKGATFIPHWIEDLSIGDSIYYFGDILSIPIIGWSDIRILPLLMLFTQLFSTIFSSNIDLKNIQGQQKFLFFGMPIIFFFILYNMPSGLLIYWITTNIFTIVQQYLIKKYLSI